MGQQLKKNRASAGMSDATLLERCRNRDRMALETMARSILPRVRKTVFFLVGSSSDSDDLVQTAMMRVFSGIASFRGESSLGAWVDAITLNTVRQHWRRRVFAFLFASSEDAASEQVSHWPSPEEETAGNLALRRVSEHLQNIKPKKREATMLSVLYGYSVTEIAALVGCTAETAKKRVQHGRRELLRLLGHSGSGQDALLNLDLEAH
ncbi:MAG: RNA polymerase sigma factor, partial [Myxococcota bacterium]|nr:RNA polymerase sigma factor [Myxococcota bacterium]